MYGGKAPSEYSMFERLNNNPGCVRIKEMEFQCYLREFTECNNNNKLNLNSIL